MRLSPFWGVGRHFYKHGWIRDQAVPADRPTPGRIWDPGCEKNRSGGSAVDTGVMRYGTLVLLLTLAVLLVGALSACGGGGGGGY